MKTWQYILHLFRLVPWLYAVSFVLQIMRLGIIIVPGLIVRQLFNVLSGDAPARLGLWSLIALLVAVALARVTILLTSVAVETTCYSYAVALMRKNVVARILARPGALPLPFPVGDVLTRVGEDLASIAHYLTFAFMSIGMLVEAVAAIGVMLTINARIALVVAVPLLVGGIVVNSVGGRLAIYRRASRTTEGQASAFLSEVFGAVQAVQVASAETGVVEHLRALNETRHKAALRERMFIGVVLHSFTGDLTQIAVGIMLLLVGQAMRAGSFTVGDFALFVAVLPSLNELSWVGVSLAQYTQTGISIERVLPLLGGAPPETLVQHGPVYLTGPLPPSHSPTLSPSPPPPSTPPIHALERSEGSTPHSPISNLQSPPPLHPTHYALRPPLPQSLISNLQSPPPHPSSRPPVSPTATLPPGAALKPSTLRWSAAPSRSSSGASAPARRPCCARCWASSR